MAILNKRTKVSDEIPSASMADIAFLLLIFFLVTTVFPKDRGLPIVLPEEQEEVEVSQQNILHINIYPEGNVGVRRGDSENEASYSPRDIGQVWRQEYAQNANLIAGVRTHPQAPHRLMIQVLDQLQLADADRVSLQLMDG